MVSKQQNWVSCSMRLAEIFIFRQSGLAAPLVKAGPEFGRQAGLQLTDTGDRRIGEHLPQLPQALACLLLPAKMAAEAQLEVQLRQPTAFAARPLGPGQSRLVAARGGMRESHRLQGGM